MIGFCHLTVEKKCLESPVLKIFLQKAPFLRCHGCQVVSKFQDKQNNNGKIEDVGTFASGPGVPSNNMWSRDTTGR